MGHPESDLEEADRDPDRVLMRPDGRRFIIFCIHSDRKYGMLACCPCSQLRRGRDPRG